MKLTLSGLFLTVVALSSAAVSNADDFDDGQDATNSTGCAEETCWASCIINDPEGNKVNAPDPTTSYVEGGDWCWMKRGDGGDPPAWTWAHCEDGCSLHVGDVTCDPDNEDACGP